MSSLPSGTVSFLFTDIEGSTKLARGHPDIWETLRERHHSILRGVIEAHHGYIFQIIGDAFCVAFHTASNGLKAAIEAQHKLQTEDWGETSVKVRMGIHTGEAELQPSGDYRGYLTLAKVHRVMSVAYGEQVLLSNTTSDLLRNELPMGITLRDLKEHQLRGLPDPERLWQVVALNLQSDFPPLPSARETPNNLPVQLTSFIGREKEIAEVIRLLEKQRMVTLLGPGGTGKTRLSIEIGNEMLRQYTAGVWFVELASILDARLVPYTIAMAIGIHEEPQHPITDTLCDYLQEKQLLLILDNCEHLIEACAKMVDQLLHADPQIRILATSREMLGIGGETSYLVPSLRLPDMQHFLTVEELSEYEAVRLFIERASAKTQNFAMAEENASSIAQICYHLDGIPLAIELAAAKIRPLSPQQIALRLQDRFRLLTDGNRTASHRHQTLRAAIEWSYNLLFPSEQIMFRRLSTFVGGWTLDAAESVCSDKEMISEDALEKEDILELLIQLVNKSLVMTEERNAEIRYYFLETIRQYANDLLETSNEADDIRNRHLNYFLDLVEEAEPYLVGADQLKWLNKLEFEHNNLRAALEWSLKSSTGESALRIAGAIGQFWWIRNHFVEGQDWIKQVTAKGNNSSAQAKALHWGSILARTQGHLQMAKNLSYESLDICRTIEDRDGIARALNVLGSIAFFENEFSAAQEIWNEALTIYRELGNKRAIAPVLSNLGYMALTQGHIERAQTIYEESLTYCREAGDKWVLSRVLLNVGHTVYTQGDLMRARQLYQEDLSIGVELRDTDCIAYALISLANVLHGEEQYTRSAQIQGAAISIMQEEEIYFEPVEQSHYDKTAAALKNYLGQTIYEKEFESGKQLSVEQAIELALK